MPYYGSERCVGCGGEDCVCCEVYLEQRADDRAASDRDERFEEWGEWDEEEHDCEEQGCDEEDEWEDGSDIDESMDGDHESGLASAGYGTDEDYGDYGGDDY